MIDEKEALVLNNFSLSKHRAVCLTAGKVSEKLRQQWIAISRKELSFLLGGLVAKKFLRSFKMIGQMYYYLPFPSR